MKNYLYVIAIGILFSCSHENNAEKENPEAIDSLLADKTSAFPFNEKEFKKFTLSFAVDTLFIQKVDTNSRITYQQVRSLGNNFLKLESGEGSNYDWNKFCELDSLKQIGKYADYVSKLDIGMTKRSIAYKLGFINLGNNSKLFIWGIDESSYEADPFFVGTSIIATFLNSENQSTHFTIGCISSAGDPPSMGNEQLTSKINEDGTINLDNVSVSDDLDVPGENITHTTFQFKIDGNKIVKLGSKTEVKNTEKATQ